MDRLRSFASRKFLIAVSAVISLLSMRQYAEAAGVAAAYILGEAAIDVRQATAKVREAADAADRAA